MTTIYAATNDNILVATILPKIARNNVNMVRLYVAFDSSWDDTVKSAVFYTSKNPLPYEVILENGYCLVPQEVLAEEAKLYITVKGVLSSGAVKTSTALTVKVLDGTPAVIISDPSVSVYGQLVGAYGNLANALAVEKARINNLARLTNGSTTGDAELEDIRVAYGGGTHATAGEAVRYQIEWLRNLIAPLTGDNLEQNPFQPLLFKRHLYFRGHNSAIYDEVATPAIPSARLGDCTRYLSIEASTQTSYAVGGELLKPIPVVANSTGEYLLIMKSDIQMKDVIINFSSGAAWGSNVHTLLNFKVDVNAGYNIIPLDSIGHTNNGHTHYNYIHVRHAGFANVQDFSIQIVRGRDVYNWLNQKLSSINQQLNDLNLELTTLREEMTATDGIVCWGDSLTAGAGWTAKLAELSGMTVYNAGTGGENVRTITARQGADVIIINDITIPAGVEPITIATYDNPFTTALGYIATPLLQGGAHVNPVKIGDIEGTLKWTGSSYNDATGVWTFTRSVAGEETVINRPTAMTTAFDREKNSPHLMVIFMGQNGGYGNDNDELVNLHRLMINHAKAKHTIVLGLSSGSEASRASYEKAMKKAFGRYFISLREYLSKYGLADAGLTATADDTAAMETGTVPPQLLADSVHYTSATKTVIGNLVYKRCRELGIFE